MDKFAECSLTREKASALSCPMVAESPVSIECRVCDIIELGSHDMFVADIVLWLHMHMAFILRWAKK